MIDKCLGYDKTSIASIFEYSKKLIGHSLRELIEEDKIKESKLQGQGKGGLEQMIESLFFNYPINSDPGPDFKEAGLELKGTGLKRLASGELQIKERLVCDMIDYTTVVNQSFEDSLFYIKCQIMLLIFYLYEKDVSKWDLRFIYTVLWKFPEKDLIIIKHDFDTIVEKIRKGEAHLLSEGDTIYLGACRKGQSDDKPRKQPFSDIPAEKRAFSLKTAYMRTVLEYIKKQKSTAVSNIDIGNDRAELVSIKDLKECSFEEVILKRFKPYIGLDYLEICNALGIAPSHAKNRLAIIANLIASGGNRDLEKGDVNNSEEFQKSGIRLKTLTSFSNGRIKEDTSFENIDYEEISSNTEWIDSRLYEIFTSRFLFVQFQQPEGESQKEFNLNKLQLRKAFFWTMPPEDINTAERYWENIRTHVIRNEIAPEYFWNKGRHEKFHVRPKARNASDLTHNPNGGMVRKYCYWFNSEYVTDIIIQQQ